MTTTITVSGHLGKAPELRVLPTGKEKAEFSVASSRRWLDKKSNEWQEKTSWINVEAWDELGLHVIESLEKGAAVVVAGRLEIQEWETEDGQKRSKPVLVADDIGASMKRATVAITKVQRSTPSDSTQPDSGWAQDEEPF